MAEWVSAFSVYYLAQAMYLRPMQPVPSEIMGLLNRPTALDVAQPLLIELRDYLQERFGKDGQQITIWPLRKPAGYSHQN